jgi:hypothetical protein
MDLMKVSGKEKNILVDKAIQNISPQLYDILKRMIIEQKLGTNNYDLNTVNTRFIPVNRMVHFKSPGAHGSPPYSSSILDPLILPGKLYILSQLANIMTKLSRAAVVRKWKIETGASNMHASMIQQIRRELYNTRITLNDLSNFKTIPKILTDFKDLFLLTKNQQPFVDVDVQPLGDASIKVADLEDARREIIALSGIPSSHLGYADMVELREALVHSNVSFANKIIDQQESDNEGINKIIDIVADILKINFKPSEHVQALLIPPITLMLQLIETSMTTINNILTTLNSLNLKIDPILLLEQYVPYINWKQLIQKSEKYNLDNSIDSEIGATIGAEANNNLGM